MKKPNNALTRKPKTGGRKKGTPNKNTVERREHANRITDLMMANITAIVNRLSLKEQADFFLKFLPYSLARLPQPSLCKTDEINNEPTIVFTTEIDPLNPSQNVIDYQRWILEVRAREKEEILEEQEDVEEIEEDI